MVSEPSKVCADAANGSPARRGCPDVWSIVVPKAIWNTVIAEASQTEIVEGNQYFPPESLSRQHFHVSVTTSTCPWKGMARYYTIVVGDRENADAAWYYPNPKAAAANIAGKVAFWKGVKVVA
jgi:uncharacterized protein (DUF427 family)